MFDKPKLSEPNEAGYQFGIDASLTEYAHKEQENSGNPLPAVDISVLQVWKDDKLVTYLLVDDRNNVAIDEAIGYEAAAVAIDKYKLLKKFDGSNNVEV